MDALIVAGAVDTFAWATTAVSGDGCECPHSELNLLRRLTQQGDGELLRSQRWNGE